MSMFKHPLPSTLMHLIAGLCILVAASSSSAHTRWKVDGPTPPRSDATDIKSGPCGVKRTNNPTILQAGDTIKVEFEQDIYHKGEYRISFSEKDDKDFEKNVLVDNIVDRYGQKDYSAMITLPNIECDECTLQLIQTMPDQGPNGRLYFSCADIQLTASGNNSSSSTESSSSKSASAMSSSSVNSSSVSSNADSSSSSSVKSSSSKSASSNINPEPEAGSTNLYFLLLLSSLCLFRRRK